MQIILELFICARETSSRVCYCKNCMDITDHHRDPDLELGVMLNSMGFSTHLDQLCAHSTSWRYENQNIILTYLVWTAKQNMTAAACRYMDLDSVKPPGPKGPLSPRPERIEEKDVLVHGLRHMSHLILAGNPFVTDVVKRDGSLSFFKSLVPVPAGRIRRIS